MLGVLVLAALSVACDDDGGTDGTPTATVSGSPSAMATETVTQTGTPFPVEPTATTGAIPIGELPVVEFVGADGAVSLPVEIVPQEEFSIGLSGRYELGERGMVFYYDPPGRSSFYMLNTHIDLDIAFVGADRRILEIREMEAESTELHRPEDVYQFAIEAPVGWYASHGIEVGDELTLLFDIEDYFEP